jgi:hypothetical protein
LYWFVERRLARGELLLQLHDRVAALGDLAARGVRPGAQQRVEVAQHAALRARTRGAEDRRETVGVDREAGLQARGVERERAIAVARDP